MKNGWVSITELCDLLLRRGTLLLAFSRRKEKADTVSSVSNWTARTDALT